MTLSSKFTMPADASLPPVATLRTKGMQSMTQTRMIEIARIDAGHRLRVLDPAWVDLLAEDIAVDGMVEPIRVVERGDGFKLIAGARRLAAHIKLGRTELEAVVEKAEAWTDDAVLLAEIKSNLLRGDLTALEQAVYVSAWCGIYQAAHEPAKRGPKKAAPVGDAELEEFSANMALNWTEAAQRALNIGRRSVFRALKIAGIDANLRLQIARLPIATKQSELLLLADQTSARQTAIIAKLTADPAEAVSVAEAIALLDNTVAEPRSVPAYERIHERFSTLKPAERERFFDLNAEAIEAWLAKRATATRKAA